MFLYLAAHCMHVVWRCRCSRLLWLPHVEPGGRGQAACFTACSTGGRNAGWHAAAHCCPDGAGLPRHKPRALRLLAPTLRQASAGPPPPLLPRLPVDLPRAGPAGEAALHARILPGCVPQRPHQAPAAHVLAGKGAGTVLEALGWGSPPKRLKTCWSCGTAGSSE